MQTKIIRIVIGVLTAFVALTAIGGGIAMLTGADRFPLEWLRGTPFSDYTIPASLLAVVVGGSSLIAAIMAFAGHKANALTALLAGLILAGYISTEIMILKQVPAGPTPIELVYLGIGLSILGLGASQYLSPALRKE